MILPNPPHFRLQRSTENIQIWQRPPCDPDRTSAPALTNPRHKHMRRYHVIAACFSVIAIMKSPNNASCLQAPDPLIVYIEILPAHTPRRAAKTYLVIIGRAFLQTVHGSRVGRFKFSVTYKTHSPTQHGTPRVTVHHKRSGDTSSVAQ